MSRYPGRYRIFNAPALGSVLLIGGFLATEASVWITCPREYGFGEYDWDERDFGNKFLDHHIDPVSSYQWTFMMSLWEVCKAEWERQGSAARMYDLFQAAAFAVEAKGYVHETWVKREFWKYPTHYELWKYFAQFRGEESYSEGEIW